MTRFRITALILAVSLFCTTATAQQVEFEIDDTLAVGDREIAYRLDLVLSATTPTRVRVEALLDLRDFQKRLPDLVAGEPVSDGCDSRTELTDLTIEAEADVVSLTGKLETQFFECTRTSETSFQRGDTKDKRQLEFIASASASLNGKCVTFVPVDMTVKPQQALNIDDNLAEDLQALGVLLLEFARKFLEKRPFCPEFPPELASLDPVYDSGGPREIEDGGLGLFIDGSIDVSTSTILDVLRMLQSKQVIPGAP